MVADHWPRPATRRLRQAGHRGSRGIDNGPWHVGDPMQARVRVGKHVWLPPAIVMWLGQDDDATSDAVALGSRDGDSGAALRFGSEVQWADVGEDSGARTWVRCGVDGSGGVDVLQRLCWRCVGGCGCEGRLNVRRGSKVRARAGCQGQHGRFRRRARGPRRHAITGSDEADRWAP